MDQQLLVTNSNQVSHLPLFKVFPPPGIFFISEVTDELSNEETSVVIIQFDSRGDYYDSQSQKHFKIPFIKADVSYSLN